MLRGRHNGRGNRKEECMARCEAPWCTNELVPRRTRAVNGAKLCNTCYADLHYEANRLGVNHHSLSVFTMKPPRRYPRREKALPCPRCRRRLPKSVDERRMKRIGLLQVCRRCYQAAWRLSKQNNITMEEAWKALPPHPGFRRRKERIQRALANRDNYGEWE